MDNDGRILFYTGQHQKKWYVTASFGQKRNN